MTWPPNAKQKGRGVAPTVGRSYPNDGQPANLGSWHGHVKKNILNLAEGEWAKILVVSNDSDLADSNRLVRKQFRKEVLVLHACGPGRSRSIERRRVVTESPLVDASV
jgi:hypothetical protein